MEHIGNARQLLWNVAAMLKSSNGGARRYAGDIEAADVRLAQAIARMTRPRTFYWEDKPDMKLEAPARKDDGDALSAPRAEIISRSWQAVSFLQEVRVDLVKNVRQSRARDMAAEAFDTAITNVVLAASLLIPSELAQLPQLNLSRAVGSDVKQHESEEP